MAKLPEGLHADEKPSIRAYSYLVALVDYGTQRRAAQMLDTTSHNISRTLKFFQLDKTVRGDPIQPYLRKQGNDLVLTEHGWSMLPKIREMLECYDTVNRGLPVGADTVTKVRLGFQPYSAEHWWPRLQGSLKNIQLKYKPVPYILSTEDCLKKIRDGELDMAIIAADIPEIYARAGQDAQNKIEVRLFNYDPLYVVASTSIPAGRELAQLQNETLLPWLNGRTLHGLTMESEHRSKFEALLAHIQGYVFFEAPGEMGGWDFSLNYARFDEAVVLLPGRVVQRSNMDTLVARQLPQRFRIVECLVSLKDLKYSRLDLWQRLVDLPVDKLGRPIKMGGSPDVPGSASPPSADNPPDGKLSDPPSAPKKRNRQPR